MKAKFLAGPALILASALVFTGCPPGADTNELQGLGDLNVGSYNPGELVYSFRATIPSAESYTLYHIQGVDASAARIMAEGTPVPTSAGSERILAGFTPGGNYSVVVVATRAGFANAVSRVVHVEIASPDLVIRPGAGSGEIIHSFSATVPSATYILYYVRGSVEDADEIIETGSSRNILAGSHTADGFGPGETYSIVVVVRRSGEDDMVSEVVRVRASAALVPGLDAEIVRGGYNPHNAHMVPPWGHNHIELAYSFGSPVPAAPSLSLYFIQEADADVARIIRYGNTRQLGLGSGETSGFTGDIRLSVDYAYSAVVVARGGGAGGEDMYSTLARISRVPNNILTVHGIPESSEIMVSAILDVPGTGWEVMANLMNNNFATVAVGYRIPGTEMFVFYEVDENEVHDPTRPWIDDTRVLHVTLSSSEEPGVGEQVIASSGGTPSIPMAIPVTNRLARNFNLFRSQ